MEEINTQEQKKENITDVLRGDNSAKVDGERKKKIEVALHSMPKKFKKSEPEVKKAKGIGLLILVGGFIILVSLFIFLYYFLVRPSSEPVVTKTEENNTPAEVQEEKKPENIITPIEKEATSTEENATTTIIIDEDATTTISIETGAPDADIDGLADIEELLFDCSPDSGDCDNDGYPDQTEIFNLYDPALAGGRLEDNANIAVYENPEFSYTIYYPDIWLVNSVGGNESILFKANNNQFIQVILQTVENNTSLDEWYLGQVEEEKVSEERRYLKEGWEGIRSDDGMTIYMKNKDRDFIFIVTYNVGLDDTQYFKNIFEMMVQSLELKELTAND